jgi:hypothetical protein
MDGWRLKGTKVQDVFRRISKSGYFGCFPSVPACVLWGFASWFDTMQLDPHSQDKLDGRLCDQVDLQ